MSTQMVPSPLVLDPYVPRLARVLEVREEIAARGASRPVRTLVLERNGLSYRAGQFLEVSVFGAGEIPLSISSPPGLADTLAVTVRASGLASTLLAFMRPGHVVGLRGPLGNGFRIGLAPLRGLLWELLLRRERYGRIVLLHGARTPHDLLYDWQWEEWRDRGVEIQLSSDVGDGVWERGEAPPRIIGFLPALFPRLDLDPARALVFLCGPPIMIHIACRTLAATYGYPEAHLITTLERHMKCGIGKCGHCVVVDRYVCMDGPVFRYDELVAMDRIEPPW
jgi:NAD(P)H-flavin reductase